MGEVVLDVRQKYLDFFRNSQDKRVEGVRRWLVSKGLLIEDLMRVVDVDDGVFAEFVGRLSGDGGLELGDGDLRDYLEFLLGGRGVSLVPYMGNWFRAFKGGFNVKKGSMPQMMFGCGTCPKHKRVVCPHGGDHVNGGCSERYRFYAHWLQSYRGATVPRMMEHLAALSVKAQEISERDGADGVVVSREWLAVMRLIAECQDRLQKAAHGSTVNVRKEITVKDVRRKFFESGCDVVDVGGIIDGKEEVGAGGVEQDSVR